MAGDTKAFTIPAGGTYPINGNGETYIFCQFADRPIRVKIAGKTVTMRAGGYQEFEPLAGPNARVEFENTDPDNPAAVAFVMGNGTYDEKIVRGEIMIEPGLRKADGTFVTDTRHTVRIDLMPKVTTVESFAEGQILQEISLAHPELAIVGGAVGEVTEIEDLFSNDSYRIITRDRETLQEKRSYVSSVVNHDDAFAYVPGAGVVGLDANFGFGVAILNDVGQPTYLFTPQEGPANEDKIDDIAYDPVTGGILTYCGSTNASYRVVRIYDLQGNQIFEQFDGVPVNTAGRVTVDPFTGHIAISSADGETLEFYKRAPWELVEAVTLQDAQLSRPFYVERNDIWAMSGTAGDGIKKLAVRDYTTKPLIRSITPGCDLFTAYAKPQDLPQITADIQAEELPNGLKLSGELIKAAIEYHYRRKAPDDYLDHVYQFDLTQDGSGQPFKTITGGNASFARTNVIDNFTTILPGRVVLVLDNELELGAAI
ncbi:hypothetical protein [Marinobacter sp.]|uniref:hypothetical protein n=1 Tax=Marinobacter sp. TaxID=50741 RepID=UPI0035C77859